MATVITEQEAFFTAFEPSLKNRFLLTMDGVPSYLVKMTQAPRIVQTEKVLDHINLQRYVKGKSIWQAVEMQLWDPVTPSGAQTVMEWIRLHHESVTGRDGYADFYKKDLILNKLGPVGDKVGEWLLKGAFIVNANFGDYDWANDDIQLITLSIRYDLAILNY